MALRCDLAFQAACTVHLRPIRPSLIEPVAMRSTNWEMWLRGPAFWAAIRMEAGRQVCLPPRVRR